MSALDDILGHLPEADRSNYARIMVRYGIKEDAPEVAVVALMLESIKPTLDEFSKEMHGAVSAIEKERRMFESTMNDLPTAIRSVGTDIAVAIADNISKNIEESVVKDASGILHDIQDEITSTLADEGNAVIDTLRDYIQNGKSIVDRSHTRIEATASTLEEHAVNLKFFAHSVEKRLTNMVMIALVIGAAFGVVLGGFGYSKTLGVKQARTACRAGIATILKGHGTVAQAQALENEGCQ